MRLLPILILIPLSVLSGCFQDETVSAYGAANKTWALVELDGQPFGPRATLTFPERGKIAGKAPCNSYSGTLDAPYPWFDAQQLVVTRMACPDLEAEAVFFAALSRAGQSEVAGDTLILRNDAGQEMVFKADD